MKRFLFILLLFQFFLAPKAANYATLAAIENILSEEPLAADLPIQYKYLPLWLTDMHEGFTHPYGAGIWALSVPAARYYGLRITADYDERYNVKLATKAALAYLKDLQKIYPENPEKVLEVYARNIIKSTDNIVTESKQQVNNIIVEIDSLILAYQNIYFQPNEIQLFDTLLAEIVLDTPIRIADFYNYMEQDSVMFFANNPALKPAVQVLQLGYKIYVPKEKEVLYAKHLTQFEELKVTAVAKPKQLTQEVSQSPLLIIYKVESGDTLGHIAIRYSATVSQIKKWNGLQSDMLQIGQKLKIYQ